MDMARAQTYTMNSTETTKRVQNIMLTRFVDLSAFSTSHQVQCPSLQEQFYSYTATIPTTMSERKNERTSSPTLVTSHA